MRTILYLTLASVLLNSCQQQSDWQMKADKVLVKAIEFHKKKMDESYSKLNFSVLDGGNKPADVEVLTNAIHDMRVFNQQLDSLLKIKEKPEPDANSLLNTSFTAIKKEEYVREIRSEEFVANYTSAWKENTQTNLLLHELLLRKAQSQLLDSYTMELGTACLRFTIIYPMILLPSDTLMANSNVQAYAFLATSDHPGKKIEYFANKKWEVLSRRNKSITVLPENNGIITIPYRYKLSYALFQDTTRYAEDTLHVNTNQLRCP